MKRFFKRFLLLAFAGSVLVLGGLFLWVRHEAKPFVERLNDLDPFLNPVVLHAADGTAIGHLRPFQGRMVDRNDCVELHEVNPFMVNSLVALEDGRSDYHPGVDPIGVARAAFNSLAGHREGASTLEAQVIRNIFDGQFDPYGTDKPFPKLPGLGEGGFGEYRRKALELYLAVVFHKRFGSKGKEKVKLAYLNICHFCPERRGVSYAARFYLGKDPGELSDPEAILLARLPQRPVLVRQSGRWREIVESAVRDLARNDYIDASENYELHPSFDFGRGPAFGGRIPARRDLYLYHAVKEAGWALREIHRSDPAFAPANRVDLTIIPEIQKWAYDAILRHVPHGAEAAVVVLDREGGVVALVGGRSPHGPCRATALSCLGIDSTLKSFIALAAIENGILTLESRVRDEPLAGNWPRNLGRGWKGTVTLKEAFSPSLNPWAVQYGIAAETTLFDILNRLEIPCPKSRVELLGCGQGTTLVNLTAAYSIFLNNGFRPTPGIVRSVSTPDGQRIWKKAPVFLHVANGDSSKKVALLLEDAVENPRGTASALGGLTGEPVLAKTGSSKSQRRLQILLPERGLSIGIHVFSDGGGDLPAGAETSAIKIASDLIPRLAATQKSRVWVTR